MASTFRGIQTGKTAIVAASLNQDVTGQNIANVNTTGYSRQYTVSSAKLPAGNGYIVSQVYNKRVGQGVEVTDIAQYRSSYLDQQYRSQNSTYNYYEYRGQGLTYLTGVMNELDDDSSITLCMNDLKTSLETLAGDPTSQEYRLNVQQQATTLLQNIHYVHSEMIDLWQDQNTSVQTVADGINSKLEQVTLLNEAISSYERTGTTANDLRDQRNNLLDELSGLVGITYNTNADNASMVDVQLGGVALICGTEQNQVLVSKGEKNAYTDIEENVLTITDKINSDDLDNPTVYTLSIDADTDASDDKNFVQITSGELLAHMQMLSSTNANVPGIPYYIDQLNQFAQKIVTDVNAIHQSGYIYPNGQTVTLPETDDGTGDHINFFEVPDEGISAITAGNISLSEEVADSVWNIAASAKKVDLSASSTNASNAEIAQKLYEYMDGGTLSSDLNTLVGHLAITAKTNSGTLDTSQSMLKSVSKQRTSLTGVSMDEETTNLIMFQQSYNVASRMITTVDEMLDTLINGTGLVGL